MKKRGVRERERGGGIGACVCVKERKKGGGGRRDHIYNGKLRRLLKGTKG